MNDDLFARACRLRQIADRPGLSEDDRREILAAAAIFIDINTMLNSTKDSSIPG